MNDQDVLPTIIQGGMGVAVSGWELARAVCQTGELGVVSGTALDVVCARRLQTGDPGGHMRKALAAFPIPAMALRVMKQYYIHGGKARRRGVPGRPAVHGHPAGRAAGAGRRRHLLRGLAGQAGAFRPRGDQLPAQDRDPAAVRPPRRHAGRRRLRPDRRGQPRRDPRRDPRAVPGRGRRVRHPGPGPALRRRARVRALQPDRAARRRRPRPGRTPVPGHHRLRSTSLPAWPRDPSTRPFGFIVEGPERRRAQRTAPRPATGRRARPARLRRPRHADLAGIAALGLPFWLAGAYGTPEGLAQARATGAQGIQVGTAFAYSQESGLADSLKRQVLAEVLAGTLDVRSDWRASPTGFPFRVIQLEGTVSDPEIAAGRKAVCDLGALRTPYKKANGDIDYRCPAEPLAMYTRKGGRAQNAEGRRCLCNALLAAADLPQQRPDGSIGAVDRDLRATTSGRCSPWPRTVRAAGRTQRARSWTTCSPDLPRSDRGGPDGRSQRPGTDTRR